MLREYFQLLNINTIEYDDVKATATATAAAADPFIRLLLGGKQSTAFCSLRN